MRIVDFEFVGGDNRNVRFKRQECSYYDRETEYNGGRQAKIKGRTRFAFINKYGVWDYFNIPYPAQKQAKIKKSTYVKPQLNWQDISNTTASAAKPYRSDLFNVSSPSSVLAPTRLDIGEYIGFIGILT